MKRYKYKFEQQMFLISFRVPSKLGIDIVKKVLKALSILKIEARIHKEYPVLHTFDEKQQYGKIKECVEWQQN